MEVEPGGSFRPVDPLAELGDIEVELEDPLLRQVPLERPRQKKLLELPKRISRRREVEVLGQLLRDRGAAVREFAILQVASKRSLNSFHVDGVVFIEGVVLRHEHRAAKVRRDAAIGDEVIAERVVLPRCPQLRATAIHERRSGGRMRRESGDIGPRCDLEHGNEEDDGRQNDERFAEHADDCSGRLGTAAPALPLAGAGRGE